MKQEFVYFWKSLGTTVKCIYISENGFWNPKKLNQNGAWKNWIKTTFCLPALICCSCFFLFFDWHSDPECCPTPKTSKTLVWPNFRKLHPSTTNYNPKWRFEGKTVLFTSGARFICICGASGDVLDAFQSILSEIEQILHFLHFPQILPLQRGGGGEGIPTFPPRSTYAVKTT